MYISTQPIPFRYILFLLFLLLCQAIEMDFDRFGEATNDHAATDADGSDGYGVDVSFPIHHKTVSTNYPWLPHNLHPSDNKIATPDEYQQMPLQPLGNRQSIYDEFIQGCRTKYPQRNGAACDATEDGRISMSLRQPASMQNYTSTGFHKLRTPDAVWELLQDFWSKNSQSQSAEAWPKGTSSIGSVFVVQTFSS